MSENFLMNLIWDDSVGPLENAFSLIEMGTMFVPGYRLVTLIGASLGFGPKNFGRWLDEKLNLRDLESFNRLGADVVADKTFNELEKAVESAISTANKNNTITKEAFAGAVLRKLWTTLSQSRSRRMFKSSWRGFFRSLFNVVKNLSLGGLGALTLTGIRGFDDSGKPYGEKLEFNKQRAVSTKETADRMRSDLETAVERSFKL